MSRYFNVCIILRAGQLYVLYDKSRFAPDVGDATHGLEKFLACWSIRATHAGLPQSQGHGHQRSFIGQRPNLELMDPEA